MAKGAGTLLILGPAVVQAQLSGVRGRGRPPVIFVGQAAVVIAGVLAEASSFASGPLAACERARTSRPR